MSYYFFYLFFFIVAVVLFFFFFFSSRRRHTRCLSDWSSDVCSSDLTRYVQAWEFADSAGLIALLREDAILTMPPLSAWYRGRVAIKNFLDKHLFVRSEERRVGKECRSRWSPYRVKKKCNESRCTLQR